MLGMSFAIWLKRINKSRSSISIANAKKHFAGSAQYYLKKSEKWIYCFPLILKTKSSLQICCNHTVCFKIRVIKLTFVITPRFHSLFQTLKLTFPRKYCTEPAISSINRDKQHVIFFYTNRPRSSPSSTRLLDSLPLNLHSDVMDQ